jgi:hypothetical protein
MDQPTLNYQNQPSLNSNAKCLKVIDTFRKLLTRSRRRQQFGSRPLSNGWISR